MKTLNEWFNRAAARLPFFLVVRFRSPSPAGENLRYWLFECGRTHNEDFTDLFLGSCGFLFLLRIYKAPPVIHPDAR